MDYIVDMRQCSFDEKLKRMSFNIVKKIHGFCFLYYFLLTTSVTLTSMFK